MIDLKDKNACPVLEEIGQYVNNPVFMQFCSETKTTYKCKGLIEFSSCSWEKAGMLSSRKREDL